MSRENHLHDVGGEAIFGTGAFFNGSIGDDFQ
jgi:hypothetical protein